MTKGEKWSIGFYVALKRGWKNPERCDIFPILSLTRQFYLKIASDKR